MKKKNGNEEPEIRTIGSRIKEKVERMLYKDEKIEAAAPCDLSVNGNFTSGALFLTNRRLLSFDPSHKEGFLEISIDDIQNMEIETLYGNHILAVTSAGKKTDVNRFTYSTKDFFDDLIKVFEEKHGKIHVSGRDQKKKSNRCPKCGRILKKKGAICPFCIDKRKVIIRLLSYVKPHFRIAAISVIFAVLVTAAGLAPPYFSRILVDDVVMRRDLDLLWIVVGALLFIYLIHAVFGGLSRYSVRKLSERIIYDIRTQVFAKAQSLPIDYFDKRSTGAIMSRISNDTQQLQGFIVQATQNILIQILTLMIIGAVMFTMNWQLALITLIPVPLVTFGAKYFSRKIRPVYHRIWRRRAWMNAILGDTIPGIRVIKAFTGEKKQADNFNSTSEELWKEHLRAAKMASIFTPAISFMMMTGGVIIWGLGGYWVITSPERLSLGVLVAFISYAWSFFGPIQFLAGLSDMIQQATTSAERVFEILDNKPEPNLGQGKEIENIKGEVTFNNVTFYYEKDKKVLENIDLTVRPGETIGIVGATGSGKTTIANLLLRFYDPVEGRVLLDGTDIADLDIRFLRENIGFVLQEPLLFRDTIANNISYSKPAATEEEIVRAAKAANAHRFISEFPNAYDTRVGERGVGLSGGERQRVSIARAIIKNPSVLILDEATASVDTETEHLIQDAVNKLIKNRTTFIIAHRLSTLREADRILVLEHGRIAELGTHDELMEKQGIFYKLIKLQTDIGANMINLGFGG